MKDTALHIPLILGLSLLPLVLFYVLNPITAAALMGSWQLYLREVTQGQIKHELSFTQGWNPWKWSAQKNAETFVPIILLQLTVFVYNEWGAS
jgi:hypothetical protein